MGIDTFGKLLRFERKQKRRPTFATDAQMNSAHTPQLPSLSSMQMHSEIQIGNALLRTYYVEPSVHAPRLPPDTPQLPPRQLSLFGYPENVKLRNAQIIAILRKHINSKLRCFDKTSEGLADDRAPEIAKSRG